MNRGGGGGGVEGKGVACLAWRTVNKNEVNIIIPIDKNARADSCPTFH